MKVTKDQMVLGHSYQAKNTNEWIYLGRQLCRVPTHYWADLNVSKECTDKRHIFYDLTDKKFKFEKGFTKLAKKLGDEEHPEYVKKYTEFFASKFVSNLKEVILKPIDLSKKIEKHRFYGSSKFFVKKDDLYYLVRLGHSYGYRQLPYSARQMTLGEVQKLTPKSDCMKMSYSHHIPYYITTKDFNKKFEGCEQFTIKYLLESGTELEVPYFEE